MSRPVTLSGAIELDVSKLVDVIVAEVTAAVLEALTYHGRITDPDVPGGFGPVQPPPVQDPVLRRPEGGAR